jgi:CDP-diacylglycerol--glycerol-3-phosphate 3-phosphatidyltransferase
VTAADGTSLRVMFSGTAALAAATVLAGRPLPFLVGATAAWLVLSWTLAQARASEPGGAGPLGLATQLTLLRAWLVSAVAGFVLAPPRAGALAWAPGLLYTVAALCDLVDGYVARRRGEVSAVGARLDVAADALGLVIGPLAAVVLGRLPVWYLALGAAYYLFHGGLALRRRRGRPVHLERLRPSRYTRQFAGCQMGLVSTALFPVVGPPATTITAALFMTAPLVLFVRDYLVVTGRLDPDRGDELMRRVGMVLVSTLPLPLRVIAAAGLATLAGSGALPSVLLVAAILVALGVLTRITAFAAAVGVALVLASDPSAAGLVTFTALAALILTGAGPVAMWSPEDRLMLRRAGERPAG